MKHYTHRHLSTHRQTATVSNASSSPPHYTQTSSSSSPSSSPHYTKASLSSSTSPPSHYRETSSSSSPSYCISLHTHLDTQQGCISDHKWRQINHRLRLLTSSASVTAIIVDGRYVSDIVYISLLVQLYSVYISPTSRQTLLKHNLAEKQWHLQHAVALLLAPSYCWSTATVYGHDICWSVCPSVGVSPKWLDLLQVKSKSSTVAPLQNFF